MSAPHEPSDEELARTAKSGGYNAFDQLHARLFSKVRAACASLVGGSEQADDLSVETFARAWGAMARCSYDPSKVRRFQAWLLKVAKNVCIDHLRWHQWKFVSLDEAAEPDGTAPVEPPDESWDPDRLVSWTCVRDAWEALPHRQRLVLAAKYWAGETWEDVADGLGCSVQQARSEAARARSAMARHLGMT